MNIYEENKSRGTFKMLHVKQFEKMKVSVKHEYKFKHSNDKPFT